MKYLAFYLSIFTSLAYAQQKMVVSGTIQDASSGETIPSVHVQNIEYGFSTLANSDGYYSITIETPANPPDSISLKFSMLGYRKKLVTLATSTTTQRQNVILDQESKELDEVYIKVDKVYKQESEEIQMSKNTISNEQIKETPTLFGEKDVIKTLQLLPGVQSGTEGSSGIYVRGGSPDQNLILLDGAPIYNPMHLMGLFSTFNGDAIKSVELYKGGFDAEYGGRLSSVIDIQTKEGNTKGTHGEAGIGLISSRLLLEGPLVKDKVTYMVSGRRSYLDLLTAPIIKASTKGRSSGGYYFQDLTSKVVYRINDNYKLSYSGYYGRDNGWFRESYEGYGTTSEATGKIRWGNTIHNLNLKTILSPKLYNTTALISSSYIFKIFSEDKYEDQTNSQESKVEYKSKIHDVIVRSKFNYTINNNHTLNFGLESTQHYFTPGALNMSDNSEYSFSTKEFGFENAVFVSNKMNFFDKRLRTNVGLRSSNYTAKSKTYAALEPRVALAYKLPKQQALKFSYSLMNQYVHLLSSSNIGLPTDIWLPTTDVLTPERSQQIALGYVKDFDKIKTNLTVEAYYKHSEGVKMYKEGSSVLIVEAENSTTSWEDNIADGQGEAYGLEVLLHKKEGKFNGWLGYTLSWTKVQFDDLNNAEWFFPRQDRRNDISLLGTYKLNKKIKLSAAWTYGTGAPVSLSTEKYPFIQPGNSNQSQYNYYSYINHYDSKNNFRMADFHHLDLGIRFYKKLKRTGWERNWEISIYNVYARRNPFFYSIEEEYNYDIASSTSTSKRQLVKYSIFSIVPSFTYNLTF